jgi:hypothetical protein
MMKICQCFLILVFLRPIRAEAENFQDIFGVLPDFQLHETLPVQATSNAVDEGKSSGRKRKADGGQSKVI